MSFDLSNSEMERMWVLGSFMRKVDLTSDGSCWLWLAGKDKDGYGKWQIVGTNRKVMAHRFAYETFVGDIPEGLTLDHLCRVRDCVNPAHLEPVTNRENVLRGRTLPALNASKIHCPEGHELIQRGKQRICRICLSIQQRDRYWQDPEKYRAIARKSKARK